MTPLDTIAGASLKRCAGQVATPAGADRALKNLTTVDAHLASSRDNSKTKLISHTSVARERVDMGIGSLVARLIAAGTPPEVAAEVVAEAFAAGAAVNSTRHPPDSQVEKRRAWDRKYRQNKRQIPPDSTRLPPDPPDSPLSLSNLEEEKKEKEREGEPTRCPPDWQPTADDRTFAAGEGFAAAEIDREIGKFRDYWTGIPGSKGLKLGWSGAWRKWIRDGADRRGKAAGPAPSPTNGYEFSDSEWEQVVVTYKKIGLWSRNAGPSPDSPACRCPREILAKHGVRS